MFVVQWIRSNICASQINNLLGYAVGSKYVEKMFDDRSKTEVKLVNLRNYNNKQTYKENKQITLLFAC
jgi:predicted metalloendopeptidase